LTINGIPFVGSDADIQAAGLNTPQRRNFWRRKYKIVQSMNASLLSWMGSVQQSRQGGGVKALVAQFLAHSCCSPEFDKLFMQIRQYIP
jgi:hypothetical protein